MPKCFQGNFVHWDNVSYKSITGFWSYLKKLSYLKKTSRRGEGVLGGGGGGGGGGVPPPPPPPPSKKKKKNWRRVSKIFDAHCTPRVFKHFEFLFMHLWMLCAPHLVPDIEYFARINHVIFNWQQKFGNKFTRDCLK